MWYLSSEVSHAPSVMCRCLMLWKSRALNLESYCMACTGGGTRTASPLWSLCFSAVIRKVVTWLCVGGRCSGVASVGKSDVYANTNKPSPAAAAAATFASRTTNAVWLREASRKKGRAHRYTLVPTKEQQLRKHLPESFQLHTSL